MTDIFAFFTADGMLLFVALLLSHAALQLGVSLLTLLSSHSLGQHRSVSRLLTLSVAYITGNILTHMFLIVGALGVMLIVERILTPQTIWNLAASLLCALAAFVAIWYFRPGAGTSLWLPRSLANYLTHQAKKASTLPKATRLGATAALAELPLSALVIASLAYLLLQPSMLRYQPLYVGLYSCGVGIPLIIITVLLAGGHRLSTIQRWRESNKVFIQYVTAAGLLVTALYIIVFYTVYGGAQ